MAGIDDSDVPSRVLAVTALRKHNVRSYESATAESALRDFGMAETMRHNPEIMKALRDYSNKDTAQMNHYIATGEGSALDMAASEIALKNLEATILAEAKKPGSPLASFAKANHADTDEQKLKLFENSRSILAAADVVSPGKPVSVASAQANKEIDHLTTMKDSEQQKRLDEIRRAFEESKISDTKLYHDPANDIARAAEQNATHIAQFRENAAIAINATTQPFGADGLIGELLSAMKESKSGSTQSPDPTMALRSPTTPPLKTEDGSKKAATGSWLA